MRFRVELLDDTARGYMLENFGAALRLPELGPIGSNCLANSRDFKTPVAWYEDVEGDFELIAKFTGGFWRASIGHSPLDVVAWHGTHAPYKYDLRNFNTIGSISYDHPDPSIFTVLTAPSDTPGTANMDFAIFPPRILAMENTFRPPWFHRNIASEFMGLIQGVRCQGRRLRARRRQPAQLHERPRRTPRPLKGLARRHQRRALHPRHHGLHVRDAPRDPPDRPGPGLGRIAGRLLPLLAGHQEALRFEQA